MSDSPTATPPASEPPPTRGAQAIWGLQLFVILAVLWVALAGLDGLLVGLAACAAGAVLGAWLVPSRVHPWKPHRFLAFIGFFLSESVKGGFDVAWRALHPGLPIDPQELEYPLDLPAGHPRTVMVSILSLLPGTLSVELLENDTLIVHTINRQGEAAARRLEHQIGRLFSLDREGVR